MRKLLVILPFISLPTIASHIEYVAADGTLETQLCIAATKSENELKRQAKLLKIDTYELSMIACNKTPLNKFPQKFKKVKSIQ